MDLNSRLLSEKISGISLEKDYKMNPEDGYLRYNASQDEFYNL